VLRNFYLFRADNQAEHFSFLKPTSFHRSIYDEKKKPNCNER